MSDIGLFEAMYSARALRRLKPDPVPDEIISKILDAAIRAPSAGNSQLWGFRNSSGVNGRFDYRGSSDGAALP